MKKTALITTAICLIMAAPASAGFHDKYSASGVGGFVDPAAQVVTIANAKSMRDDTMVTLRGNIEKRLGKDKYLFKDATDSITVEIDKRVWRGVEVSPEDTVEIYGELDKDVFSSEIDVDRITKISVAK